MINGIFATSLLLLICSPAVAQNSNVNVNLSADAMAIPDGYVVPEGNNVTFICTSSLGGVSWTLDLKVPDGSAEFQASVGLARSIPQVSSPDTTPSANPATITIHNVAPENNQSTVECSETIMDTESSARVIVEGSPNCPTVNATVSTTLLTVSIQKPLMRWLPEQFYVKVSYYDNGSMIMVHNSTLKGPASFDVTPVQLNTVYNISVIPCNMAGCNESCDIHSVQTADKGGNGTRGALGEEAFVRVLSIIVGVAVLAAILLLLLIVVILSIPALFLIRRARRARRKASDAPRQREKAQTQSPEPIYDTANNSTVISNKNMNKSGYFNQQRLRGPATFIRGPGNGASSTPEYATVTDAIPMGSHFYPVRATRPEFSPPPTPCLSPEAPAMNPYSVQDVGYCSPLHRHNSKKAKMVRNTGQCEDQKPENSVYSSEFV